MLGRLIKDNVMIAYEILHTFNKKGMGKKGFMTLKLNMTKTYDRIEWVFLRSVILKMGFPRYWVDFIMHCISIVSYFVVLNAEGEGERIFKLSRGLRQRDPLSPYLFLFCYEGLSSLMRMKKQEGLLWEAKVSRRGPLVSHLMFADDCILFGDATKVGAQIIKKILKEFEDCLK